MIGWEVAARQRQPHEMLAEVRRRREKLYRMGYEHGSMGAPRHEVVGALWPTYSQGYDDALADRQRILKGVS